MGNQTTDRILMIEPVNFSFNAETAVNNAFQVEGAADDAQVKAHNEFENFVRVLRGYDINVTVIKDTPLPYTPDSIFPNNWISFHGDTICLYPMYAPNRRQERKPALIELLKQQYNISKIIDFSDYESQNKFLEGTGSMVLDRENKIAYACLSPRTDIIPLDDFCRTMQYTSVLFDATDANNKPIYHTNVMMCVADAYVVICLDSIRNEQQKQSVINSLNDTHKQIVSITLEQMNSFAGNMLQVENKKGEKFLVMSSQAYASLKPEQVSVLEQFNTIIHAPLTTIETNGGGSARCMMAEMFV